MCKIVFTLLSIFLRLSVTQSTEKLTDYLYTAAVVEYKPLWNNSLTAEENINLNAREYISLLNSTQEDLEIILFPEATLGGSASTATKVPLPFTEIICNSTDTTYKDYLKVFSCSAIVYNTTVVVNLMEKENCTLSNSTGFCPSSGLIYYNSNVAFNNTGGVIGRYRKWNLFGEFGKSTPAEVELVSITTKNNNTFGIFTCFDLMFAQPALNLTRNLGLKNILFPTMWFSELPYLTALQAQQMWAEENDVNFLSAGASNPPIGSGGSAIFVGEDGPLAQDIIGGTGGSKVIVRNVPRPEVVNNPYRNVTPIQGDVDALAVEMDDLYLRTDPSIGNYSSIVLDTNKTTITEEVCNGDSIRICCQFKLTIHVNDTHPTASRYTYHLAAFNGIRSFSGVRDGGIESCGVLACLNDSITSCGSRFSNYSVVSWPITFEVIEVSANFTIDDNRIQFPNSLLASIRPLSPRYTLWSKEVSGAVTRTTLTLTVPQNRLLTFGIFGRDFGRDSGLIVPDGNRSGRLSGYSATVLVLVALFLINGRL